MKVFEVNKPQVDTDDWRIVAAGLISEPSIWEIDI